MVLAACKRCGVCKALPCCRSSCRAAARCDGPFPRPAMEKPAQRRFSHWSNTMAPAGAGGNIEPRMAQAAAWGVSGRSVGRRVPSCCVHVCPRVGLLRRGTPDPLGLLLLCAPFGMDGWAGPPQRVWWGSRSSEGRSEPGQGLLGALVPGGRATRRRRRSFPCTGTGSAGFILASW